MTARIIIDATTNTDSALDTAAALFIAAHPVKHLRVEDDNTPGIGFDCLGCGYHYETVGRDNSSRQAANYQWARHVEAVRA